LEFRGWNLQKATAILGTRKFIKGFFAGQSAAAVWGYNKPVEQNEFKEPWIPKIRHGHEIRYLFFGVVPGNQVPDAVYPESLVVDYRLWPKNSPINPLSFTVTPRSARPQPRPDTGKSSPAHPQNPAFLVSDRGCDPRSRSRRTWRRMAAREPGSRRPARRRNGGDTNRTAGGLRVRALQPKAIENTPPDSPDPFEDPDTVTGEVRPPALFPLPAAVPHRRQSTDR
jgi:hypothetical protein